LQARVRFTGAHLDQVRLAAEYKFLIECHKESRERSLAVKPITVVAGIP
jgi:hypothetical protein